MRTITPEAFRQLSSPLSWLQLVDVEYPEAARAIIAAMAGAPASDDLEAEYERLTGKPYPDHRRSQVALQAGRGAFKSSMAGDQALDCLLRFDAAPYVAPGSEVTALIVAPSKKQGSGLVRAMLPKAQALASLLGGRVEERALAEGGEIVFRIPGLGYVPVLRVGAADEATVRGGAFCFVAFSECGWMPSGANSINSLADLRVAIVPRGVGQFPYFLELLESTNGPPSGYFYDVCTSTPPNVLKIGPLASFDVNPSMDAAKLQAELSPEAYSQEVLCQTWGLKSASWFTPAASMAVVDETGEWTDGTLTYAPGARVGFDHGGKDEIATMSARKVAVEVSPGVFVDHMVIDLADFWRPTKAPPTSAQVALPKNVSRAQGGVPVLCDGRAIADVTEDLAGAGYQAPDVRDHDVRRKVLTRGGKVLVQMPMASEAQTLRFTKLREMVHGGRVHAVASEGGREFARQLVSARATTLANRYLKVEAESGAEDGLLDCASYLAEAFDSMPAVRKDGVRKEKIVENVRWNAEAHTAEADTRWRLVGPDGEDRGPAEPDPSDEDYPMFFVSQVAMGISWSPAMAAFVKARTGLDEYGPKDLGALVDELVREGSVPANCQPVAAIATSLDPIEQLKAKARRL